MSLVTPPIGWPDNTLTEKKPNGGQASSERIFFFIVHGVTMGFSN
jgi:hypothetical protein